MRFPLAPDGSLSRMACLKQICFLENASIKRAEHLREVKETLQGFSVVFSDAKSVFRLPKISWFYPWFIHGLSMFILVLWRWGSVCQMIRATGESQFSVARKSTARAVHGLSQRWFDVKPTWAVMQFTTRTCRAIWLTSGRVLRDPWEWLIAKHYKWL